jgi:hypothetical protein
LKPSNKSLSSLAIALLSLVLGLIACVPLLYMQFQATTPDPGVASAGPLVIGSDKMRMIAYKPYASGFGKLRTDIKIFSTRKISLDSTRYPYVTIQTEGDGASITSHFFWRNASAPRITHRVKLPWLQGAPITQPLLQHPGWQGEIVEAGLIIAGKLERVMFRPESLTFAPPSFANHLSTIVTEWLMYEGWSQRSINFRTEGKSKKILSINLAVGTWLGVSLLIFSILLFAQHRLQGPTPPNKTNLAPALLVLIALPWLALDLLWQTELLHRVQQTYHLFYGKSVQQRRLAMKDEYLYDYAQYIKGQIFQRKGERAFIFSGDTVNYESLKLRYYLSPIQTVIYPGLPQLTHVRNGDLLIFLAGFEKLAIDRSTRQLTFPNGSTVTASLIDRGDIGLIFRTETSANDQ